MLSRLFIYPFLIQQCKTLTLYWLSMRLHSLMNAMPCFMLLLYFCVTDKCIISCNNTRLSFSSSQSIPLFILMDLFLRCRFLSISNSNCPTMVLKLLLINPILALLSFPSKYNRLYSSNLSFNMSTVSSIRIVISYCSHSVGSFDIQYLSLIFFIKSSSDIASVRSTNSSIVQSN